MAQGNDDRDRDGAATPEMIRAEIGATRAALSERLEMLKDRLFVASGTQGKGAEHTMAAEKSSKKRDHKSSDAEKRRTKPDAAPRAGRKQDDKSHKAAKPASAKSDGRKQPKATAKSKETAKSKGSPGKRLASRVLAKTAEVAEEMLTGAAIGAVTGAAARVQDQPEAFPTDGEAPERKPGSTTAKKASKKPAGARGSDVLTEMATGAAVGAAAGAAKAIVQEGEAVGRKAKKTK